MIFLLPFSLIFETPWDSDPSLASTISLLYLGVVATGMAWLIRFRIFDGKWLGISNTGSIFNSYLWSFFGYFVMDEIITWRVLFHWL